MHISVTYEESDVAKALGKIIKDPNAEEFIKLFTPIICGSSQTVDHFFKLMIGNKLPDVIPNGTLCKIPVSSIGYGMDKEATLQKYGDADGCLIVTIIGFRGYHEYSQYTVEYTGITGNGNTVKDTTYVRASELEILEDF